MTVARTASSRDKHYRPSRSFYYIMTLVRTAKQSFYDKLFLETGLLQQQDNHLLGQELDHPVGLGPFNPVKITS